MLRTRVITALVLVTCFLLAVFWLPALAWGLLTLAAILLAAHEWSALAAFRPGVEFAFILVLAACGAWLLFAPPHSAALYIYGAAMLFWFVAAPLWFYSGWKPVAKWAAAVVGVLILLPAWLALVDLRGQGVFWLLGAMALVWIADIAAYFSGRTFGRHKLAPAISPGKTWEGVAGAVVAVLAYAVLVIAACQFYMPRAANLDATAWPALLALAAVSCGISVIGDLFESAVKRRAGVKDSGVLLPGHGGLLDRIDALLPVLPLAALVTLLFARNHYATA